MGSSIPSPLFDSASDPVFLESKTNFNPSSTDRKDAAASRKSRLNQEEPDRDEEAPVLPSGDMQDRRRSCPATSADMMEAQRYRKARKYLIWVLLAIIVLLAAIVGVVITLLVTRLRSNENAAEAMSSSPTSSPTFVSSEVLQSASSLSASEAFDDFSSPQYRAVLWMSNVDLVDTTVDDITFEQRYAMVVVYYSFFGEDWLNQEQWLNPDLHECNWSTGVLCKFDATARRSFTGFDATRNNLQGSIPAEL